MKYSIGNLLPRLLIVLALTACGSGEQGKTGTASGTAQEAQPDLILSLAKTLTKALPPAPASAPVPAPPLAAAAAPASEVPASAQATAQTQTPVPAQAVAPALAAATAPVPEAPAQARAPTPSQAVAPSLAAATTPIPAATPATAKTTPKKAKRKKPRAKIAAAPKIPFPPVPLPAVNADMPEIKPIFAPSEEEVPIHGMLVLVTPNDAINAISWTPINENASYNIYWSTTPGVNKSNGSKIYGAVSPQTHTGVLNGTTYYYVVTEVINGVEGKESMQASGTPVVPGDPVAGKKKSLLCQGCHGENGNSTDTEIPKLAGQYAKYIAKQLRNYQSGTRTHAIMSSMAATISDEDLADISAHFATQPIMKGNGSNNPVAMKLFLNGDKSRKLLACVNCHGVNGKGLTPNTAMFPVIGGQYKDYIRSQLLSFRKGFRTNSPNGIMNLVTGSMTDEEIEALAEYVSGL